MLTALDIAADLNKRWENGKNSIAVTAVLQDLPKCKVSLPFVSYKLLYV